MNNRGDIRWHQGRVFVSEVFRNEEIGLEQMDEDVRRVFFCNTELGDFNSSARRVDFEIDTSSPITTEYLEPLERMDSVPG